MALILSRVYHSILVVSLKLAITSVVSQKVEADSHTDCVCPADWKPVCFSNNTFVGPNACYASCKGYGPQDIRDCAPLPPLRAHALDSRTCVCTLEYRPVCDERGVLIAANPCAAECLGYTEDELSFCFEKTQRETRQVEPLGTICPAQYKPVCDKFGNEVAGNACEAEGKGIEDYKPCSEFSFFQNHTKPEQDCVCTTEYSPVCTADGVVVGTNACNAECRGFSPDQFEPCVLGPKPPADTPDCGPCTLEDFPQCLPNGTEVGANPCDAACNGFDSGTVPCTLLPENASASLPVFVAPRPICRCTKEYEPYCDALGTKVGSNKCNALCNGYSEEEIAPCVGAALRAVERLCRCPKIFKPVCDSLGTELGDNECIAECKGYSPSSFSEANCGTPSASEGCEASCGEEGLPVCDMSGTRLGPNTCAAECKGYAGFSSEFCTERHAATSVLPGIASRQEGCLCPMVYSPMCDEKGTVVAANPCVANCTGYDPEDLRRCFFVGPVGRSGEADSLIALEGPEFARLANSTSAPDLQTVCVEPVVLGSTLPALCTTYSRSAGEAAPNAMDTTPSGNGMETPTPTEGDFTETPSPTAWRRRPRQKVTSRDVTETPTPTGGNGTEDSGTTALSARLVLATAGVLVGILLG
eukprot:CAMPEP_0177605268 /NCGR_PEP_ID=MMETSP0419_2-20121207/16604_1 /TAXON_ID=582737 /ORGANISM="Tetraselmis sp., Strain GSL018" /LENGTH=642 /DNA_ID=CAMNT_0019099393 /DNA_START=125 /DNA_END=2053 /DNA_ORIENTATION=+